MRLTTKHYLFIILIHYFLISACSVDNVHDTAESFVIDYYVKSDLKAALKNTVQEAKKKVSNEIASIQASGTSQTNEQRPKVSFELVSKENRTKQNSVYLWKVKASTGNELLTKISLAYINEHWYVSNFIENVQSSN